MARAIALLLVPVATGCATAEPEAHILCLAYCGISQPVEEEPSVPPRTEQPDPAAPGGV